MGGILAKETPIFANFTWGSLKHIFLKLKRLPFMIITIKIHKSSLTTLLNGSRKISAASDRLTIGQIIKISRFFSVQSHNTNLHKARVIPYETLEEAIAIWVLQMKHRKICLFDDLIQKKHFNWRL